VGLVMSMSKKRPAPVAGAFGDEEEKRKEQKTEKIRDLDDRTAPKVGIKCPHRAIAMHGICRHFCP